jgi:hypothetical protein
MSTAKVVFKAYPVDSSYKHSGSLLSLHPQAGPSLPVGLMRELSIPYQPTDSCRLGDPGNVHRLTPK